MAHAQLLFHAVLEVDAAAQTGYHASPELSSEERLKGVSKDEIEAVKFHAAGVMTGEFFEGLVLKTANVLLPLINQGSEE